MRILYRLLHPWSGVREARSELNRSRAERPRVQQLGRDLQQIHDENHIAARVHRAARGGTDRP